VARSGAQPEFGLLASGRLQAPLQQFTIPVGGGRTISINRALQGTAGVAVTWPLWTGGRVSAATRAAHAQLDAAEADLEQATEQLLYEAAVAYYDVLRARSARAAAESALRQAEEDHRTARARRAAGTMTSAAVSMASAAQRQARQELAAAESAVSDAEQRFNRLLGRPLDEGVRLVDEPVLLEAPERGDEAVGIALATRPELLALDRRREAAQAAIAQARADRRPTVGTLAEAAVQTTTDVLQEHAEFIGLQFSWPILDHSAPRARERGARASVEEFEQTKADLEALVTLQVAESARRVSDAGEQAGAADEALQAAEAQAREAGVAYRAGTATRQVLVAAESARDQAQARHRQAEYGLSMALLARARAMGLMRATFLIEPEEGGE
jgi:outer membrane protein